MGRTPREIVGRAPEVTVPSDREIPKSLTDGVPIVLAAERSDAARAFRGLAERYVDAGSSNGSAVEPAAGAPEHGGQQPLHRVRELLRRR